MKKWMLAVGLLMIVLIVVLASGNLSVRSLNQLSGELKEQELNLKPIEKMNKSLNLGDMLFLVAGTEATENSVVIRTDQELNIMESYELDGHYENIDFSTEDIYIYNDKKNETYDSKQMNIKVGYDKESGGLQEVERVAEIESDFSTPYISLWTDNTLEIIDEGRYEKLNDPQITIDGTEYFVVDFTQNTKVKETVS